MDNNQNKTRRFFEFTCSKCKKPIGGYLVSTLPIKTNSTDNKLNHIKIINDYFQILCFDCLYEQLKKELDE